MLLLKINKRVQTHDLATEKTSYGQIRSDALSAMAEHFIATATIDNKNQGLQTLAGHEHFQVILHLNVDSLKKRCNNPC